MTNGYFVNNNNNNNKRKMKEKIEQTKIKEQKIISKLNKKQTKETKNVYSIFLFPFFFLLLTFLV